MTHLGLKWAPVVDVQATQFSVHDCIRREDRETTGNICSHYVLFGAMLVYADDVVCAIVQVTIRALGIRNGNARHCLHLYVNNC